MNFPIPNKYNSIFLWTYCLCHFHASVDNSFIRWNAISHAQNRRKQTNIIGKGTKHTQHYFSTHLRNVNNIAIVESMNYFISYYFVFKKYSLAVSQENSVHLIPFSLGRILHSVKITLYTRTFSIHIGT